MSTLLQFMTKDAELREKFEALAPHLSRMNISAKVLEFDFNDALRMLQDQPRKDGDGHRASLLHVLDSEIEQAYQTDFDSLPGDIVIVSSLDSVHVSRKIIAAGALDYVAEADFEEDLIDSLGKVGQRALLDRKIIGFTGVGAGTGCSTVAQLFALQIVKEKKHPVALVDFDLTLGRQAVDFGLSFKGSYAQSYAEDPTGNSTVDGLFQESADGLHVFAAPHTLSLSDISDFEAATSFLQTLRATYPVTVLDIPTRMTGFDIDLLKAIDDLVVVATPDLVGLRNLRNLKTWVAETETVSYALVLNKQPIKPKFSEDELKTLLGPQLKATLPALAKPLEHQERLDLAKATHVTIPKPFAPGLQSLAQALELDSLRESGKKKAFKFW